MKSPLRVAALIGTIIAIVFGITFVGNYMVDGDPDPDGGTSPKGSTATNRAVPLRFGVIRVNPIPASKSEVLPHHIYGWKHAVEVGGPGSYGFWCRNENDQPVTVRVPRISCQCGSVDLGVVPPKALQDYGAMLSVASFPTMPIGFPICAVAGADLAKSIKWDPLFFDGTQYPNALPKEQTVPAAVGKKPQFAIVRMNYVGKGSPRPVSLNADVFAAVPGQDMSQTVIEAGIEVVSAFEIFRRTGPGKYDPSGELPIGELKEKMFNKVDFYVASFGRDALGIDVSFGPPVEGNDPCVTWTDAVAADPERFEEFRRYFATPADPNKIPPRIVRSLYRIQVTVNERVEVEQDGKKVMKQLDLGPIDRRLRVAAGNAGAAMMEIRGTVLGDVTLQTGAEAGRIEMGNAFSPDEDRIKDVTLIAERPGLELKLLEKETHPVFLKTTLEKLSQVDGRNRWKLRVVVPKGSMIGGRFDNKSMVILQTNDPIPRRIVIPIRGAVVETGGPRI